MKVETVISKLKVILRVIDLGYQTVMFLVTVGIIGYIIITRDTEQLELGAMAFGLYMGPWQVASCLLMITMNEPYRKQRGTHLFLSACYFALILVMFGLIGFLKGIDVIGDGESQASVIAMAIVTIILGGIPAALSVFYYYITVKSFFARREEVKTQTATI